MTVGEPVEETGSTRDGDLDPELGAESVDTVTSGGGLDEPDTEATDLTPLVGGAADDAVRGVDEILGREVRLVTLPPVSGEVLSERIEQVRHLARLHHPHLLEVYDVDGLAPDTEGTLVLENVSGEPLPLVLREGPIDDADLARMGAQLASALSHAHAHHVHHGAIGPSSVLVDRRRSAAWLVGLTASLTGPLPVIDPEAAATPDDEAAQRAADVRALARTLADVATLGAATGDDPEAVTLPATRGERVSPLLALLRDVDTALPPSAAALSERLVRLGRDETADTDDAESSRLVPVVASWTDTSAAADATAAVVAAGPAVRARGANGITPFGIVAGPTRRARRAGVLGAATATLALASGLVIYAGEAHVVRQTPQAEVGTALPVTAAAPPVLPGLPAQPASADTSGSSGSTGTDDDETPVAPPSLVGSRSAGTATSAPVRVAPPVPVPAESTVPVTPVEPTTKPVEPTTQPTTKPPESTTKPTTKPSQPGPPPSSSSQPPAGTTTTVPPVTTTTPPPATTTTPPAATTTTTTTTAPGAPAAVLAAGLPG
ncbi:hypothetical protein [Actinomycetospora atypica]|uniref:Protein kinase domain-containing protein n=1 Tax=Actinomycetospora atypica TaxID=1290095 RepID=A0ABV9YVE1_9PSEU